MRINQCDIGSMATPELLNEKGEFEVLSVQVGLSEARTERRCEGGNSEVGGGRCLSWFS